MTSIEKFGIIQPILFRHEQDRLYIVAGERLMKEQNLTQEQLGGIVGKARSTVRDILTINRQTLIEIARKKQERSMISAYKAFRKSNPELS